LGVKDLKFIWKQSEYNIIWQRCHTISLKFQWSEHKQKHIYNKNILNNKTFRLQSLRNVYQFYTKPKKKIKKMKKPFKNNKLMKFINLKHLSQTKTTSNHWTEIITEKKSMLYNHFKNQFWQKKTQNFLYFLSNPPVFLLTNLWT
jgi:hypothetical protein